MVEREMAGKNASDFYVNEHHLNAHMSMVQAETFKGWTASNFPPECHVTI